MECVSARRRRQSVRPAIGVDSGSTADRSSPIFLLIHCFDWKIRGKASSTGKQTDLRV